MIWCCLTMHLIPAYRNRTHPTDIQCFSIETYAETEVIDDARFNLANVRTGFEPIHESTLLTFPTRFTNFKKLVTKLVIPYVLLDTNTHHILIIGSVHKAIWIP